MVSSARMHERTIGDLIVMLLHDDDRMGQAAKGEEEKEKGGEFKSCLLASMKVN